jgi:hypothetical protein
VSDFSTLPAADRPTTDGPTASIETAGPGEGSACHWDYCPNCSTRLHNAGCKYRCPRCHYFMSCSDFD